VSSRGVRETSVPAGEMEGEGRREKGEGRT